MVQISSQKRISFFKNFRKTNPTLLLGLIIISFGTYMIPWIYIRNKDFKSFDNEAPDENRGAVVLFMFPVGWAYVMFIVKKFMFDNLLVKVIEYVGWSVVIFLFLKYLYDFCVTFGRLTGTKGFYWFLLFVVPFLTIPAMQSELNSQFDRLFIKKKYSIYYK